MKKGLLFTLFILLISGFGLWAIGVYSPKSVISKISFSTEEKYQLRNGDIIFQSSTSGQSLAIQYATKSKYSHVGIIYEKEGEFMVYEAVQPVKITPLSDWITHGDDGHYVVKRLKNADVVLTEETFNKMKEVGEKFMGKNYDLYFEWSDDRIYCSELVYKIYKDGAGIEIGELQKLSDFDLTSDLVKQKMKERYGQNVPMNELVISPGAMFDSDLLETVVEN